MNFTEDNACPQLIVSGARSIEDKVWIPFPVAAETKIAIKFNSKKDPAIEGFKKLVGPWVSEGELDGIISRTCIFKNPFRASRYVEEAQEDVKRSIGALRRSQFWFLVYIFLLIPFNAFCFIVSLILQPLSTHTLLSLVSVILIITASRLNRKSCYLVAKALAINTIGIIATVAMHPEQFESERVT